MAVEGTRLAHQGRGTGPRLGIQCTVLLLPNRRHQSHMRRHSDQGSQQLKESKGDRGECVAGYGGNAAYRMYAVHGDRQTLGWRVVIEKPEGGAKEDILEAEEG